MAWCTRNQIQTEEIVCFCEWSSKPAPKNVFNIFYLKCLVHTFHGLPISSILVSQNNSFPGTFLLSQHFLITPCYFVRRKSTQKRNLKGSTQVSYGIVFFTERLLAVHVFQTCSDLVSKQQWCNWEMSFLCAPIPTFHSSHSFKKKILFDLFEFSEKTRFRIEDWRRTCSKTSIQIEDYVWNQYVACVAIPPIIDILDPEFYSTSSIWNELPITSHLSFK